MVSPKFCSIFWRKFGNLKKVVLDSVAATKAAWYHIHPPFALVSL